MLHLLQNFPITRHWFPHNICVHPHLLHCGPIVLGCHCWLPRGGPVIWQPRSLDGTVVTPKLIILENIQIYQFVWLLVDLGASGLAAWTEGAQVGMAVLDGWAAWSGIVAWDALVPSEGPVWSAAWAWPNSLGHGYLIHHDFCCDCHGHCTDSPHSGLFWRKPVW